MGSKVNPAFISAAERLKYANARLKSLQNSKNSNEYRKAEIDFHRAEKQFCNQQGLIEDKNPDALPKEQALKQVDMLMKQVKSWYA